MNSLSTEVLAVLGNDAASPEVERIVREYGLTDVQEDPPFRRYVGSTTLGLSLLFDHERLIDAQFYAKPTKRYQPYAPRLPFGLEQGMTQQSVRALLGEAARSDESYSKYLLNAAGVKLIIEYDKSGVMRYICAAPL
jgi:hypothetical protein